MNPTAPPRHGRRSRFRTALRGALVRPLRDRRLWIGVALVAAMLVIGIVAFRRPLAQWLWPDTRIQQLLAQVSRL